MWFKGNINVSCMFRNTIKAWGTPTKKVPKGSILNIHAQVAGGGHGVWSDGVPSSPPKELA